MASEKPQTWSGRNEKLPFTEAWRAHPIGYPRLSERMGLKPETLIFRKFGALNARMLLYMQAELVTLERRLQQAETRDRESKVGTRWRYATDFWFLLRSQENEDTYQLELVEKIQQKLGKYNKAILQQYQMHQMPEPDRFDLDDMYDFLYSQAMGDGGLAGEDAAIWGSASDATDHAPDLVGVCPREQADKFSRFISENAIHLFKCGLGRLTRNDKHLGRRVYYDSTVLNITNWTNTILASLLPVASILVLINLHTFKAKLLALGAFNVMFSVCLISCTNTKRGEIFAMTAAFAAVQAVFLGTDCSASGD